MSKTSLPANAPRDRDAQHGSWGASLRGLPWTSRGAALVQLFSVILFGALTTHVIFNGATYRNEFGHHLEFAQKMEADVSIVVPHFLFQAIAIAVHQVVIHINPQLASGMRDPYVDDSWLWAAAIIMPVIYLATVILLGRYIHQSVQGLTKSNLLAVGVLLLQPIFIFAILDLKYYFGYITPANIYVIPTQTLLKLTSLAVFMCTPLLFKERVSRSALAGLFLLVLANGLSKPNYLLVALPGTVALLYIMYRRGRKISWPAVTAYAGSALLVLSWQYYFKFVNPDAVIYESSIALTTPFDVLNYLSASPAESVWYTAYLAPVKIILSIAFPLYVAFAYRRSAFAHDDLLYAWLMFPFGLFLTLCVVETGQAKYAGNFWWSGQIACFLVFAATTKFFFSDAIDASTKRRARYLWGQAFFLAHLLCGIIYYVRSFSHEYE